MHIVFTIANNSSVPYFKWFAEEASKQKKHTFSFVALHSERPDMIEDVSKFGWKCHWIQFDNNSRKKSMVSALPKLIKLFKKIKPDVVHSHLFDDSLPTLFAAKLAGVKKRVITKQDTTFHYFYAPKWVKADKFNNRNATHLIPVSKEAEEFIIDKENADPKKITMIHHGIPPELFTKQTEESKNYIREKFKLDNRIVIGTVARLIDWKGYIYLIEAAEIVVKNYPSALFLFVGEGPQEEELRKLVRDKGLENNITFTGWLERKHIPSLYAILDVYAHPANYEPFGFVIPEAMMNQAPVVSTPTGSSRDAIVNKENGVLVPYKDNTKLAEGIEYAINHGKEFKIKGQETALKMYNFKRMFDDYIKLYES